MLVTHATCGSPGSVSLDLVVVGPSFVVVLDGVTEPRDGETGCGHGGAWFVARLGDRLAVRLAEDRATPLAGALAKAIDDVRGLHGGHCDLGHPETPSSTVALLRECGEALEYLVLCDSSITFEHRDGWITVSDDRTAHLPAYDRPSVQRLRNRPGGFWVASTRPEAADEAISGELARAAVRVALVCTDGVSRLVEYFGWAWPDVVALAERDRPTSVIDAVRAEELRRPPVDRARKLHDDATAVLCWPSTTAAPR